MDLSVSELSSPPVDPHGESFTLSFLLRNTEQKIFNYLFLLFGFTRPGIEPEPTASAADTLIHSTTN